MSLNVMIRKPFIIKLLRLYFPKYKIWLGTLCHTKHIDFQNFYFFIELKEDGISFGYEKTRSLPKLKTSRLLLQNHIIAFISYQA